MAAVEEAAPAQEQNHIDNYDERIEESFAKFDEYADQFCLGRVGLALNVSVEQVDGWTKVTGKIQSDDELKIDFKKKAVRKYEFDPATGGTKLVKQYRRLYYGTPVTFDLQWVRNRWRAATVVLWEPAEFEKIVRQILRNEAFEHRLITRTFIRDNRTQITRGFEETIWKGTDLNLLRSECPRTTKQFMVTRGHFRVPNAQELGEYSCGKNSRIKTAVLFEYYDPFTREWVECLDPR